MRYLPILTGLAGCFLADARYSLGGEKFSTSVSGDYSGWSVIFILGLFGVFFFLRDRQKKSVSPYLIGFTAIYLLGFALFRAWQTFTLYEGAGKDSLATKLGATVMPGEGLLLLLISGGWLLLNAFRNNRTKFSTRVE